MLNFIGKVFKNNRAQKAIIETYLAILLLIIVGTWLVFACLVIGPGGCYKAREKCKSRMIP